MPAPGPAAGSLGAEMRGKVIEQRRYTRADLRANPDRLFVFGDNLSGLGRGGQARECRGEPNAIGIPTKWHPTMDEAAFFTDCALPTLKPIIQGVFRRIDEHMEAGGDIVWPADGVGTGLAQLPSRAPAVLAFIERCRAHLLRC